MSDMASLLQMLQQMSQPTAMPKPVGPDFASLAASGAMNGHTMFGPSAAQPPGAGGQAVPASGAQPQAGAQAGGAAAGGQGGKGGMIGSMMGGG